MSRCLVLVAIMLASCARTPIERGPTTTSVVPLLTASLRAVWWPDHCPAEPPCIVRVERSVYRSTGYGITRRDTLVIHELDASDITIPLSGVDSLSTATEGLPGRRSDDEVWVTIALVHPLAPDSNTATVELEILASRQTMISQVTISARRANGQWRATVVDVREP